MSARPRPNGPRPEVLHHLGAYQGEPRIYRIVCFHFNGRPRAVRGKSGPTLAEAQAWCSRDDTSSHSTGPGAWFHGYELMPGCKE